MERTSERIWRAARAAYESRAAWVKAGWEMQLPDWHKLNLKCCDVEYDAMVAAFKAVDALWQMGPGDEGGLPRDIQRLLIDLAATDVPLAPGWASVLLRARVTIEAQAARIAELEAALFTMDDAIALKRAERAEARIAELEAVERELRVALSSAIKDRDKFWKAENDLSDAYVRLREMIPGALKLKVVPDLRYGDNVPWAHTEACLKRLVEDRDGYKAERDALEPNNTALAMANLRLEGALKPFVEYAERIEKERPGWKMAPTGIPMSWFIAALKAYRGEDSKTEDDKT